VWIPNARFPAHGSTNGIEALADYVHGLGLKLGIHLTPGISAEAVARNTEQVFAKRERGAAPEGVALFRVVPRCH